MSVRPGAGGELQLVRAAQAGDLSAFEQLYRSAVGLVYALCLRMAGSAALAEELTQDVFVRAWRKLPTFRGESAFATWLTRLAVNVVLTERRDRGRRDARLAFSDDLDSLAPSAPAGHPGEIARLTGLAVGTCKSHLHRARALLREVLGS